MKATIVKLRVINEHKVAQAKTYKKIFILGCLLKKLLHS